MNDLVEVNCLCGSNQDRVRLSTESPVAITVCHCNPCRYSIGSLYCSYTSIVEPPSRMTDLSKYDSSHGDHYSCGKCGTKLYRQCSDSGEWHVFVGAIEHGEQVFGSLQKTVQHLCVADSIDGGLTIFLPGPTPRTFSPAAVQPSAAAVVSSMGREEDGLVASCHCGRIRFLITRPSEASATCTSPWPDLIRPYHSHDSTRPCEEKWWIRGHRFLAGACTCRSCRLAFGTSVVCWAFIPRSNVVTEDGSPWVFDNDRFLTCESSPGIWWESCRRCGASCFWHCDLRPDILDVSVGILRAAEGSRAEGWLEWWTDRVSFVEDAQDKAFGAELEAGLRAWGQRFD